MEGCWDDDDLKKLSVNSCIGLWNMNNGERYSVRSSPDNEEGQGAKYRKVFEYEGGEIYDHIFLTQMLDNASMRPIHQQTPSTPGWRNSGTLSLHWGFHRMHNRRR